MATFTNQATLSYNNTTTSSNVVTGQLLEVLSAAKTAVTASYAEDEVITYILSIVNSGAVSFTGLTVTDDLGGYTFAGGTLYPLDYIPGSLQLYINGVRQAAPAASAEPPLEITGLAIPANSNAMLVYEARVNRYASLAEGSTIVNTAVIDGGGLSTAVEASATVTARSGPRLTISKSICPATVTENGQLTYTFVIQNSGSSPAGMEDAVVVQDVFDPVLEGLSVALDGTAWVSGVNYTYQQTTGEFATNAGQITVPAATYVQDPLTGLWSVQPGVAVLTVNGTV